MDNIFIEPSIGYVSPLGVRLVPCFLYSHPNFASHIVYFFLETETFAFYIEEYFEIFRKIVLRPFCSHKLFFPRCE